jgi:hypothetical protein
MKKFITLALTLFSLQLFAQNYRLPQATSPANNTMFSAADMQKPITFRWTPVIPKPQEPVIYRIRVWQLMQGQTGLQAMKANQPVITKDFNDDTEGSIANLIIGPCKLPYLCSFVWTVQAINRDKKPFGNNNGMSEASAFSASSCDVQLSLKLQSITCLPATRDNNNYKICIAATYVSTTYSLTYANSGSGLKAYAPSYSPVYSISNIAPALQVQNTGPSSTVNYCFNVSVPVGQTNIKIGLQGDDKNTGPIVCQAGAELAVKLPECKTCDCGTWSPLTVNRVNKYECGSKNIIAWKCNQPFNFIASYQCSPNNETCQPKTSWNITKDGINIKTGNGTNNVGDSFTPSGNGTYVITLNAICNGIKCTPCSYTINVNDCIIEPCPQICNGDFEQFSGIQPPTSMIQADQNNIPCWKTTEADHLIEIWKSGFNGVLSHSGTYFAEINAREYDTLFQTFTIAASHTVMVSFAHRGRYTGLDVMKVALASANGTIINLGTYSDNNGSWKIYSTIPQNLLPGTYKLMFESIYSNGGNGPQGGGNFLDSVILNCVETIKDK